MSQAMVIIPVLNEAAHLPGLLEQFAADPCCSRIIIADGGSTDGSQKIVERASIADARIILMLNPDRVQSAGVNRAVAQFGEGYEWLLRVDAHCRYPDGYASGLLRAAAESGADSVVVPMVTEGHGCFQKAVAAAQNSAIGTGGSPHRHVGLGKFVDHGHHALMRISSFRRAGGYCEAMSHNEDAELDHRINGIGGKIWLDPASAITYFPRSSVRALWRQYFGYGRGRAQTVRRHKMRLKLRQVLPLAVPGAIILAVLSPLHFVFALPLASWAALVLAAGVIVGLRSGLSCALASGVAAMVMHAAWGFGFIRGCLGRKQSNPVLRFIPEAQL